MYIVNFSINIVEVDCESDKSMDLIINKNVLIFKNRIKNRFKIIFFNYVLNILED